LSPTRISLQLADHSIKYPIAIFEVVPIKVGELYVPIDFVVLDMAKYSRTQIILGRPFLATVGCKIDVKEGKLTFNMGEHHVEFGLSNDVKPFASFACCGCDTIELDEPVDLPHTIQNDPSSFSCPLFEGLGLDNVKVDSVPPGTVETKPYAVDEGYLSSWCRFVTLWMSMPPMSGGVHKMDVDFEFKFELLLGKIQALNL